MGLTPDSPPLITSSFLEPPQVKGIGAILEPTKSIECISQEVSNLSNGDKYSLLYNHVKPPSFLPSSLISG